METGIRARDLARGRAKRAAQRRNDEQHAHLTCCLEELRWVAQNVELFEPSDLKTLNEAYRLVHALRSLRREIPAV
jgi:hypothetical protein